MKEQITEWWQWRPKCTPEPTKLSYPSSTVKYGGEAPVFNEEAEADMSVEGRLTALEEKYKALQNQLGKANSRITAGVSRIDAAARDERQERREGDQKNAHLLKELSTGGLSIEWMGLVWLFIGIVCATIPEEIASLLSRF